MSGELGGSAPSANVNSRVFGVDESPRTSLVIPTRGRPQMIVEVVESVLAGDYLPTEIVVLDQSEDENTEMRLRADRPGAVLRYLWRPDRGLSRARNAGFAEARYGLVAFIDDDVRVASDWWRKLIRKLVSNGPNVVVTGALWPGEPETPDAFVPTGVESEVPGRYSGRVNLDPLRSANMAMYRSVLQRIGPFDERLGAGSRFPGAEDHDLGHRLLEAGYLIEYDPQVRVFHRAWRQTDEAIQITWNYARGQGAFFAKHASLRDRYMLTRMYMNIRHRFYRARHRSRRQRHLAYRDLLWILGCAEGFAEWMLTRPRI